MLPESKAHLRLVSRMKGLLFEPEVTANPPSAAVPNLLPIPAPDDAAYAALRNATLARPTEYSDFLAALNAIAQVVVQEDMRFNAALAILRGKGATPAALLRALDVHLADLESERGRFKELAAAELAQQVDGPRQTCAELDATIAGRREEMARIEGTIRQLEAQQQALESNAQAAVGRIAAAEQQFLAASDVLQQQLANDRARLAAAQIV